MTIWHIHQLNLLKQQTHLHPGLKIGCICQVGIASLDFFGYILHDSEKTNQIKNKNQKLNYADICLDEEIDGILLLGQEARKEQQEILEDSYGPGFYNVKNLERERKYNTMFLWSPFISYTEPAADELENGQFFKRIQMVSTRYEEENLAECVPETKYYDGTTICYDD